MAQQRITAVPNRMRGLSCIRSTRVTVSVVLGQLAAGASIDELLADYPYLEREDVLAARIRRSRCAGARADSEGWLTVGSEEKPLSEPFAMRWKRRRQ